MSVFLAGLTWLLTALVLIGAVPLLAATYQYLLVGVHFRRNHYRKCRPMFPRTAILIAAWNEEAVIGTTVDRFMQLEYPPESLRVVIVDDASTDDTPQVLQAKVTQYPGRVYHLRRAKGGEGKAAALNHGLRFILSDGWMEALLIGDADPIYEPAALRTMARHLSDPDVGAVTAYIKEGAMTTNYLTRFIAYEYITGQAATRRSQNVLGTIQCLAGRRATPLPSQHRGARGKDRQRHSGRGHRHHDRDATRRAEGCLRAARHRVGRRAGEHLRAVEAAPALGARERPDNVAVPPDVVSSASRPSAGRRDLWRAVVQPAAPAAVHDRRLGVPALLVLYRCQAGVVHLPSAVAGERDELPVHHHPYPADDPATGKHTWVQGIMFAGQST